MAKLRNELHRETEFRKKYNMHDLSIAEYLPKAFKNLNFSDRDKKLVRW